MSDKRDLTKGDIGKALFLIAWPSFVNMLLLFSYGVIDMFFVARLGSVAVAGVGNAMLFLNFGYALNMLGLTGIGIKVSHAIGREDYEDVNTYVSTGIYINTVIGIIFILFVNLFANQLVGFLNIQNEELYNLTITYLRSFSIVLFFAFFNNMFTRVLTSMSKSDKALRINAVGVVLNIILDPILIFGFDLGVQGAAYASAISAIVNFTLHCIYSKELLLNAIKIKPEKHFFKNAIQLGIPYTLQRILFTGVALYTGRTLARFGAEAIAGQKIGFQIESFTLMGIASILTAISVFTGQNLGACEYERIKKGYRKALTIGVIYASITGFLFIVFGREIVGIFIDDELTIHYGYMYLKFISVGQFFAVLEMIGNGLYTGLGVPKVPTIISVTITPLRIFISSLFIAKIGVAAVFLGVVVTSIMKGSASYGYYVFNIKNKIGVTIKAEDD